MVAACGARFAGLRTVSLRPAGSLSRIFHFCRGGISYICREPAGRRLFKPNYPINRSNRLCICREAAARPALKAATKTFPDRPDRTSSPSLREGRGGVRFANAAGRREAPTVGNGFPAARTGPLGSIFFPGLRAGRLTSIRLFSAGSAARFSRTTASPSEQCASAAGIPSA